MDSHIGRGLLKPGHISTFTSFSQMNTHASDQTYFSKLLSVIVEGQLTAACHQLFVQISKITDAILEVFSSSKGVTSSDTQ